MPTLIGVNTALLSRTTNTPSVSLRVCPGGGSAFCQTKGHRVGVEGYNLQQQLTYDDFKRLAGDASLTDAQRIGFPDAYRAGFEAAIVEDIIAKTPPMNDRGGVVIDIGCGASDVPQLLA